MTVMPRRSCKTVRCLLLPPLLLLVTASILFWHPQLKHAAGDRLANLATNLPGFGKANNASTSAWDDKGGRAGFFRSKAKPTQWGSSAAREWWGEFGNIVTMGKPEFDEVRFKDGSTGQKPWYTYASRTKYSTREQRLTMTNAEMESLKNTHAVTLKSLKSISSKMPFVPGTRGIVVTTAVDAMAFLTVSLRMLRRTGTSLPVEIWMYDRNGWMIDPWGLRMCEEIWKPLGATCHFVSDHIPEHRPPPYDKPTEKYLNKFDAMLFSSFEEIIFLDSDNNALLPLDDLFIHEPFKSYGMVLWPDYWMDWASPYWYEMTGIKESHVVERASTESGQIMLNKRTHALALLLAAYYGRYQKHYIRLLEQEPGGEGDKEAFLRAALVAALPVYQVTEEPDRHGFRCNGGERAIGSGQHHPEDDYYLIQHGNNRGPAGGLLRDGQKPRVLFVHSNLPKLDPAQYIRWRFEDSWEDQLRCDMGKGKAHRMWGDKSLTLLKHGWDVEKAIWDQMLWTSCNTEYLQVQWWTKVWNRNWTAIEHVCEDFSALYKELLGSGGEGLSYQAALMPAPHDENGEFVLRQKKLQGSIWDRTLAEWRSSGSKKT